MTKGVAPGIAPDLESRRAAALVLLAGVMGCGGSVVFDNEGAGGAAAGTGGESSGMLDGAVTAVTTSTSSGGSCPDDLAGRYALALAVQLGRATPILFFADVTADGDRLLLQVTPVATPYRDGVDTEPFRPLEPVGEAIVLTTSALGPDGAFTLDSGDVRIPSAANPFSSNDIAARLSFSGASCGSSAPLCGTVSGEVTQPIVIALTGGENTFALTTQLGGTGIAFPIDCNGALSNPIP